MILVGDIGGTKTDLALYEMEGGKLILRKFSAYHSKDHAGLLEVVRLFLNQDGLNKIQNASFAVAGPVRDGKVELTNLPWNVDVRELQKELSIPSVSLLNDLAANAWGICTLEAKELVSLNPQGQSGQTGNRALISAGTGLGQAGLYWDGKTYQPFAEEGGHVNFGPDNALGDEILLFLRKEHGHVSWERVLSGMGMMNLYRFFRQRSGKPEPQWLTYQAAHGDLAAISTHAGLEGTDQVCVQALDYFTQNYGAVAGDLALHMFALGGVYIGGGIAPKILPKLQSPIFMKAFTNKGRLSPLLATIPVYVILNDKTALQGAAWYAFHHG
jgi:glucokinase